MAKRYGGRWEIVGDVDRGGQAQVYRVRDVTGALEGEYALKRVLNPERHARFAAEIQAIKQLSHPNIVPLIDHSALDGGAEEKQFLIMPLALGGDLSDVRRAETFKGSIDATLKVAIQIAEALAAAHAAGIIHRDVKPANILFKDVGHDVWLGDFGICLLRERPRATELNEVVGPRWGFMAPECEEGGQLQVTPAVDVYALGKLIYFMLSGGRAMPREKLDDPGFALELGEGQRIHLLQALLRRMICALDRRTRDMNEVIAELRRIEAWVAPVKSPLSERGRELLAKTTARTSEAERIHAGNQAARDAELNKTTLVKQGFDAWIENQLELAARDMRIGNAVCEVKESDRFRESIRGNGSSHLIPIASWQLAYSPTPANGPRRNALQILLCTVHTLRVTHRDGGDLQLPLREPERDPTFMMVPYYNLMTDNATPIYSDIQGFLSQRRKIGSTRAGSVTTNVRNPTPNLRIGRLMQEFNPEYSMHVEFAASQWPAALEPLEPSLIEMIEVFLEEIETPTPFLNWS
ncbi:MAG: serine/threonine protein kinase [Hyphomonadaceae bacterium]|nr:serine/threonine protein kinase [Hyphomonadaceae bacterium]